jgi:hypothetical protein
MKTISEVKSTRAKIDLAAAGLGIEVDDAIEIAEKIDI